MMVPNQADAGLFKLLGGNGGRTGNEPGEQRIELAAQRLLVFRQHLGGRIQGEVEGDGQTKVGRRHDKTPCSTNRAS